MSGGLCLSGCRKPGQVERKERDASHLGRMPRLGGGEDDVQPVEARPWRCGHRAPRRSDRRAWEFRSGCEGRAADQSGETPRSASTVPPRVPTRNRVDVARSPPAKSNTCSLKRRQQTPARRQTRQVPGARAAGRCFGVRRHQRKRAADALGDDARVAVDCGKLGPRPLRARGGDAAHRVDDRAELLDAVDPRADVRESERHGARLGWIARRRAVRTGERMRISLERRPQRRLAGVVERARCPGSSATASARRGR